MFRLVSAPVFLLLFFGSFFNPAHDERLRLGLCLLLVLASEASDILDGYFARKYGQVSDFGRLMDPYADSAFRLTVLFSFSSRVAAREIGNPWVPLWMVVVLFYRDLLTSVLRTFAIRRGVVVAARASGKIKAIVEAVAMVAILVIALRHEIRGLPADMVRRPAYWMMLVVLVVAVWSGIDYFWACRKHMVPPEAEAPGESGAPGSPGASADRSAEPPKLSC